MSGLTNVKILFFIKRTKVTKNGMATIFVRITINKERTEFTTRKKVSPEIWDDKAERTNGLTAEGIETNNFIDQYQKKIFSYIDFLTLDNQPVSARIIQEKLVGKKEDRRTILKIYKDHNDKARKLIGVDFSADTVQRYETSYMHTRDFIRWQYKREDMALEELNQQFINNYEFYFKTVRNCSHNTTIKYIKNFKKIVRIALANGWIKKDPFATIKLRLKPVDAVYLTKEELDTIINKSIGIDRLQQVRDAFVFCCFTGLAFSDLKSLKREHITKDNDGITWIHKKRTKTDQISTIFVIEGAKKLIAKYQHEPELIEKGALLPVLSNQKMNAYLKEIGTICGIDKPISTHTARHTFATTVALENNMPLEVVSKTLGHSNTKMTQRYARTTETLIKKNMEKIKDLY
ncbi:phage integrase SAM-like domain-containing protein [Carboxylicivirga caseinilyticus]|uniref:phage integrase SAM-like domain-containing protein n=1 Tax=Carboxylicivirga caseinilyticus TaxID=3417572 RepID=UPI003D3592A5|nr:site-specific integrase [Marinilabiliaceae bacterium A049]